jgi:hypothetical protein
VSALAGLALYLGVAGGINTGLTYGVAKVGKIPLSGRQAAIIGFGTAAAGIAIGAVLGAATTGR